MSLFVKPVVLVYSLLVLGLDYRALVHVSATGLWGHKGQLAPRCRALDALIKKFYRGIQKAVHPFRFKNFEHLLGSGGEPQFKTRL